ncbi:MAG TPA: hypothetical protein VLH13_02140, partial [Methanomassiliicoccales archaeon]|nr:hypothetical protein [Methanomassiliicoccales archaeon]
FNDLVSSFDSLSLIGVPKDDVQVRKAMGRMCSRQRPDGVFELALLMPRGHEVNRWVSYASCRCLKRFHDRAGVED